LIAGSGPYERAKQSYLAEDYAGIIPACEEEIAANLPHSLRAQANNAYFIKLF
jgi:hypothetical protein